MKTSKFAFLHHGWKGQRKFAILVTLESLIWYSQVLFQHQTRQQNNQNFTFMDILQQYLFDHIRQQLILALLHKRKYRKKIKDVPGYPEFRFLLE